MEVHATRASKPAATPRAPPIRSGASCSLFGYRDPELVRYADEISTALQLTNFGRTSPPTPPATTSTSPPGPPLLQRERGRRQALKPVSAPRPVSLRGRPDARFTSRDAPAGLGRDLRMDADPAGRHHHPRQDRGGPLRRLRPAPRHPPPRPGHHHGARRQGVGHPPRPRRPARALAVSRHSAAHCRTPRTAYGAGPKSPSLTGL